ncbi:MAG: cytochrome C [Gammaproteobacteria bacterium]|nr:cytochrome C [Gammaproteobacteria bacterium]
MKRSALGIAVVVVASFSFPALAGDVTYSKDIRPLMEKKCFACHGGAASPYYGDFKKDKKKYEAAMKGPRMDTYADVLYFVGWPDTGALMRRLDDGKNAKGGKPGNMYGFLGSSDDERQKNLKKFKAWVGEDGWVLNRWKARGDVPAVTKEQVSKMKVKY